MEPLHKSEPTIPYTIYIAGDYTKAVKCAREYCDDIGFCVTVTQTRYVYRYGEEDGVIVGLINYPRFPKTEQEIRQHAIDLANRLRIELDQESFSIQGPYETEWFSWRAADIKEK